ncbi:hypothetical protein [Methylocystis sp. SB2]|uniref:hypothetical protein n=1 Tax=Methylocystis sp. (strain SB2) TaxID=743836 RepID=UPI0004A32ED1|nr:hypothetical protein [Methylocystis sp. SB2]ULO25242.1 hypothetical protein LNB28_07630 [Methylocystis sp. SB2]
MAYAKQMKLVNKLVELTNAGELEWKQSVKNDVFQLSLRDNTIMIKLNHDDFDIPDVEIDLINGDGQLVESFTDSNLRADNESPEEMRDKWYSLMSDLYESARRIALGADKVLNEILSDLDDKIPF